MAASLSLVEALVPLERAGKKKVSIRVDEGKTQPSRNEEGVKPVNEGLLSFDKLKLSSSSELPTAPQVTAHLRLLHAFACLRISVMNQQGVFGIDDSFLPISRPTCTKDTETARLAIAEKRWSVFVERAVDRFDAWWLGLQKQLAQEPVKLDTPTKVIKEPPGGLPYPLGQAPLIVADLFWERPKDDPLAARGRGFPKSLSISELPPLDVLMGIMGLWHAGLPWQAINSAIDADSGLYNPGEEAELNFVILSGRNWSNLDCNGDKTIMCPSCEYNRDLGSVYSPVWSEAPQAVPCTTFGADLARRTWELQAMVDSAKPIADKVNRWISESWGWTDASFGMRCAQGCGRMIDRESLCAKKFINEAMRYFTPRVNGTHFKLQHVEHSPPMQGTVLNNNGIPYCAGQQKQFCEQPEYFPLRFTAALSCLDSNNVRKFKRSWTFTMAGIRSDMAEALKCARQVNYAQDQRRIPQTSTSLAVDFKLVKAAERMYLRRMMSSYNDNPSRFTLDLGPAVLRQGTFVQKMQDIDWLHSPALPATASRLIAKYTRFFALVAKNVSSKAANLTVPTLDVDLAWHTHQLSPATYYAFSTSQTKGRFVDHDDKIPETDLSAAFARTAAQYQQRYGEPYSACTCWYCEAVAATIRRFSIQGIFQHPRPSSPSIPTGTAAQQQTLSSSAQGSTLPDERRAAHISAHSAVRPVNASAAYQAAVRTHREWLDRAYARAVERAQREGRAVPERRHRTVDSGRGGGSAAEGQGHGQGYYPEAAGGGFGGNGGRAAAGPAVGLGLAGVVGAAALLITFDDVDGIAFPEEPQREDMMTGGGGAGGCVPRTCGAGMVFGGEAGGGEGFSCGNCGFTESSGGDGGGCDGGCGGCGG